MNMKWFALLGLVLFLGVAVAPSVVADDTTPPVTSISLNPPETNGENGWFISNITVTLNATDNDSGVAVTYYRLNEGPWNVYTAPFTISEDGKYLLEVYSIDVAGNQEDIHGVSLRVDQTSPLIDLTWEVAGGWWTVPELLFTATCSDATSGMDHVEFYFNDNLTKIDDTAPFTWQTPWPSDSWGVQGLILISNVTQSFVSFFAFFVHVYPKDRIQGEFTATAFDTAGNNATEDIHSCETVSIPRYQYRFIFTYVTVPNNFTGYIKPFRINAVFPEYPIQ